MSDFLFNEYSDYVMTLSYEQSVILIKKLLENLQLKRNLFDVKNDFSNDSIPFFLNDMFEICDSNPNLHKSDGKWQREELYER